MAQNARHSRDVYAALAQRVEHGTQDKQRLWTDHAQSKNGAMLSNWVENHLQSLS